ncbi:ADP-ribosylglycohydrolase family protein [Nocardia harenae]|uniref:ADP-ribosylglycohydrolase family protein n=1 Tax=Nocardia harenae TaxID=358707 RepID=UPI00082E717B|nr:ADP-ribosylglycohydrolase family protein [Nocardia harenae]
MDAETHDRAAGVLLGTAAGDALGAGYEFTHPAPETPIDMIGGGPFGWAPGQWTDDTAMAMVIAHAAGAPGSGIDVDAVAAGFVRWWDSAPPDVGVQTSRVLSARPGSAHEMRLVAGQLDGRTGGNGSLMRTAPVALAYLRDETECLRAAGVLSTLTHHDERAIQACRIWTGAIRRAVLGGGFAGVREYAGRFDPEYWLPLLDRAEQGTPAEFPENGWVVHALQTAWWAIAHTPADGPGHLPRALELCVRAGGDTDTTAAIAGGLLGAVWGASAVPARWRALLHGYPGLTGEELIPLAARIAGH